MRMGQRGNRGLRTLLFVGAVALLLARAPAPSLTPAAAVAQEATTVPSLIPTPRVVVATTETVPTQSPSALPPSEFFAESPLLQVAAQGLVAIDGPVMWRVREVTLTPNNTTAEFATFSFTLQRSGATIIRNELTGRRARLEPGECYFMTGGDPYLRAPIGTEPSVVWVIELVAAATPPTEGGSGGSILLSPDPIADYPTGVSDMELLRAVIPTKEKFELPPHTGPALIMVTTGSVQIALDSAAPVPVGTGDGRIAAGAATLENLDPTPAVVVIATIGEGVEISGAPATVPTPLPIPDTTAPTPEPVTTDAPTPIPPPVEPTPEPLPPDLPPPTAGDTDGDGLSDEEEAIYGSDPLNRDYDADGILDGPEIYQFGTDPVNNDTDGDTLWDGAEIDQYGTSPITSDSDGDGITDNEEIYTYGTGAAIFDTDGDGIGDGEEVYSYYTDPLDPASVP